MKIIWNGEMLPEHKAEIEKYLNPLLWMIPKWCQHVFIRMWNSSDDECAISTVVDYEYRRVTVDFYSCWLVQNPDIKADNIVHELIHFHVNHLYHETREVVKKWVDDDKVKAYIFERLRIAVESVTQDLTYAINSKMNSLKKPE